MVFCYVVPHLKDIPAGALRHDVHGASHGQCWKDSLHGCVEGVIGMERDAAVDSLAPASGDKMHKIGQRTLGNHHALGLAGGAGGIDHIGPTVRPSPCGQVDSRAVRLQKRHDALLRQRQPRPGILHHVGDALQGIFQIDGHVGRAGLVNGQHRCVKFLHPAHAHRDEFIRLNVLLVNQSRSQPV